MHYVGGDRLAAGGKTESGGQAAGRAETKVADAKGGGEAEKSQDTQITKIEAKGEVVITSDKDQTTTSDWALYDVPAQLVTVGGNVVLTQGQNVLKGDRLVIDLKTGESRFDNTGNRGRRRPYPRAVHAEGCCQGRRGGRRQAGRRQACGRAERAASGNKPDKDAGDGSRNRRNLPTRRLGRSARTRGPEGVRL